MMNDFVEQNTNKGMSILKEGKEYFVIRLLGRTLMILMTQNFTWL